MRRGRAGPVLALVALLAVWAPGAAATPTSTLDVLDGVACPSATRCLAVGVDGPPSQPAPLAEVLTGTTWTVVAVPRPRGATSAQLSAVACASVSRCEAVGASTAGGAEHALIETWDGATWRVATAAQPAGGQVELSAVACTTATTCMAVGSYTDRAGTTVALAEELSGTTWTLRAPATPKGSKATAFQGVACEQSDCFAVGYDYPARSSHTLTEVWDGATWAVKRVPSGPYANSEVLGVACRSTTACLAVGTSGYTPVAAGWNGAAWSARSPVLRHNASFAAVACASVKACVAVGSGLGVYLAETFNGAGWAVHDGRIGTGSEPGGFAGVACPTATRCVAVGGSIPRKASQYSERALAESFDGHTWSILATPDPT